MVLENMKQEANGGPKIISCFLNGGLIFLSSCANDPTLKIDGTCFPTLERFFALKFQHFCRQCRYDQTTFRRRHFDADAVDICFEFAEQNVWLLISVSTDVWVSKVDKMSFNSSSVGSNPVQEGHWFFCNTSHVQIVRDGTNHNY